MNEQRHVVIVTGGRTYPRDLRGVVDAQLSALYVRHGNFVLLHGACQPSGSDKMTGADRYADDWARTVPGIDLRARPADWIQHGLQGGPIRNEAMVKEACELASPEQIHGLAFPEPGSRGTWNCVGHMAAAGIEYDSWGVERAREWLVAQRNHS